MTFYLNTLHQAHTHFCLLYCGWAVFGKVKQLTHLWPLQFSQSLLRSADEMLNTQVTASKKGFHPSSTRSAFVSWRWCVCFSVLCRCYVGGMQVPSSGMLVIDVHTEASFLPR